MTRAWIVIPTYNEAENLPSLVAAVLTAMASGGSGVDCSILIVDDSSPDGTGHIADALAAADGGVHVLHRPEKAGLAGADIAGFRLALAAGAKMSLAIAVEAVLRIPGMRLAANRAAVARGRQRGAAGHAPVMPGRQGA